MKLDDYKNDFATGYDTFIAKYNIEPRQIEKDLRYEKIADVTRIERLDNEFFFFKDDKLIVIYISNESLTTKVWAEFSNTSFAITPEKTVRSRAGKKSNQVIFASEEIAASITKDEVDFIEIFRPCTVEEYITNIYNEVPAFIR